MKNIHVISSLFLILGTGCTINTTSEIQESNTIRHESNTIEETRQNNNIIEDNSNQKPENLPPQNPNTTKPKIESKTEVINPFHKIDSEQACIDQGGIWMRINLGGEYECAQVYSDGGKSCTNSNECEGLCMITLTGPDPEEILCQNTSRFLGCGITIEAYNAGEILECQ